MKESSPTQNDTKYFGRPITTTKNEIGFFFYKLKSSTGTPVDQSAILFLSASKLHETGPEYLCPVTAEKYYLL
jgi:hypothetical protein